MTNDELAAVLAKLDIPNEFPSVLAIWPRWADGGVEVRLGATAFWRAVKRSAWRSPARSRPTD